MKQRYTVKHASSMATQRKETPIHTMPREAITINLADYDVTFTPELTVLLLTPHNQDHPVHRIDIGSGGAGIELLISSSQLTVRTPSGLNYPSWTEYLPIGGQFKAIMFDATNLCLLAGGLGIIDILDTDPQHFHFHELPIAGSGVVVNPFSGTEADVNFQGLEIHRTAITSLQVQFSDAPPIESAEMNSPIILFKVYYELVDDPE